MSNQERSEQSKGFKHMPFAVKIRKTMAESWSGCDCSQMMDQMMAACCAATDEPSEPAADEDKSPTEGECPSE
jgi:hypothetical protein